MRGIFLVVFVAVTAMAGDRAVRAIDAALAKERLDERERGIALECLTPSRAAAKTSERIDDEYRADAEVADWAKGQVATCVETARFRAQAEREAAEEAQRQVEAREAKKESAARARQLVDEDRSVWVDYLSWRRCSCQRDVDEASAVVKREKEKARIAGVVNKVSLNEAAEVIVDGRECVKRAENALRGMRVKPVKCAAPNLEKVAECLGELASSEERCLAYQLAHAETEGGR
jgi:hypothetical protein